MINFKIAFINCNFKINPKITGGKYDLNLTLKSQLVNIVLKSKNTNLLNILKTILFVYFKKND